MQHAIHLPQDLYNAIRKKAIAQQKSTEDLVIEWVSAQLDESDKRDLVYTLEQEILAFEQMKSSLFDQYDGQYVAIYEGKVVASGFEKLAVLNQVREQFGLVVCYVELVSSDSPRTVRNPSTRVTR